MANGQPDSVDGSRITRNTVVRVLGTPNQTEGSINDPAEREESGFRFNEKWTYLDLENDPAGARQRVVYWLRYDFAGTAVRARIDAAWAADHELEKTCRAGAPFYPAEGRSPEELQVGLADCGSRLYQVGRRNPPVVPSNRYRPVSEFEGKPDLGGHIETPNRSGQSQDRS